MGSRFINYPSITEHNMSGLGQVNQQYLMSVGGSFHQLGIGRRYLRPVSELVTIMVDGNKGSVRAVDTDFYRSEIFRH